METEQKQFVESEKTFRPDSRSSDRLVPAQGVGTDHFCVKQKGGFTLVEMLVVTVIVASLIGIAIPAINAVQRSYDSTGTLSMVESALSSARAMAISSRRYAGIRFQKAADANGVENDPLNRDQYMIYIIHEDEKTMGNDKDCFRAIEGKKPIKLPANIGIMDVNNISSDADISANNDMTAETSFSIVFSPSGKLVMTTAQMRNKDGKTTNGSNDTIFNTRDNISSNPPVGMFVQDDSEELSRRELMIYSRKEFAKFYNSGTAYSSYLINLKTRRVNPYTGTIIDKK
ncbi:MAG: prepilin-type N-terminal cleavage/methylation domain-containing protein [Anaerohalosphaeraceae bacterium]|nr:prepilin-type N-terminal cleavage/methylation domain-containing protein [Anaerohalosphaeraceae bacterium]